MRAISLFSGGLDSMLAIKLITQQNIEVITLHINIGFSSTKNSIELLEQRAIMAGAKFEVLDVRSDYIKDILFSPKYGYGKNFNPCIDCHGYMFRIAKEMMNHYDASFLVTGEVVGQRPMSQNRDALNIVDKLSNNIEDKLIVRPLCAKHLEATTPELMGWIDREKLLDISGRSRERQLALAKDFGWNDYESPSGGCLLTNIDYSAKIREFIAYDNDFDVNDIALLKLGRHFRLDNGAKLIVGRDEIDNARIDEIESEKYIKFKLPIIGSVSMISANATFEDKLLASKIAITYAKHEKDKIYGVLIGDEVFEVNAYESKFDTHKYFFEKKNK
ncbi:MAG: ATP-binding protein [Sulfurovum sp. AS07-7]|nr:MAG: ATP-binding protein [Sulfurovum sp. AS07-7]